MPVPGQKPRSSAPGLCTGGLTFIALLLLASEANAASGGFDACVQRLAAAPGRRASALCFYSHARATNQWVAAVARLEDVRRRYPHDHWLTLTLAYVEARRGSQRVEALLRQAADGFSADRNIEGELSARANLNSVYIHLGRSREATDQADRVGQLAEETDEPELKVRAWTSHAHHLALFLNDLRRAYRMLKRAEATDLEKTSYTTHYRFLNALGPVNHRLGRLPQAKAALRKAEALAEREGDKRGVDYVRVETADVLLDELALLPRPADRDAAQRFIETTLAQTVANGHEDLEIRTRWQLAAVIAHDPEQRKTAEQHLERCLALVSRLRSADERAECTTRLALRIGRQDPDRARTLIAKSMSQVHEEENVRRLATLWRAGAALAWQLDTPARALDVSLAGLRTIELIRNLQPPGMGRIGAFSLWTHDYYRLAGQLLTHPSAPDNARAQAFEVMERMRARTLLEATSARSISPQRGALLELESARQDALGAIAKIQQQVLNPQLSPSRRAELEAALADRERRAEALREKVDQARPGTRRAPRFPTPDEVRAALAKDEAMLLFQVGLDTSLDGTFGGGAWLWVLTQEEIALHRIPDRLALETQIPVFVGLFADPAGARPEAAKRLHDQLLTEALDRLPDAVNKLIIVADGRLHRLPFAALLDAADRPLAERYALTSAPSATFWLKQRTRLSPDAPRRDLLAVVDPAWAPSDSASDIPEALATAAGARGTRTATALLAERTTAAGAPGTQTATTRFAERTAGAGAPGPRTDTAHAAVVNATANDVRGALTTTDFLQLGRLPYAEREGRVILDAVGGDSELQSGEAATETAVKRALAARYRVVHFAAHALVDTAIPERSAVLLAPGGPSEDGLLQGREITDFNLEGTVVVLASCQSAAGALAAGEGTLSLARAFLAAGAETVIGSRWPLRDDDALALFETFYRRLSAGEDVQTAIQQATAKARADGRSARTWAGITVLGHGSERPFANGSPAAQRRQRRRTIALGIAAFVALLGIGIVAYRRRSKKI